MPGPRPILLFVEGGGDIAAMPVLVRRLLDRQADAWSDVCLVGTPYRAQSVGYLTTKNYANWIRLLRAACRDVEDMAAILLVLDSDRGPPKCVVDVAKELVRRSREAGAGANFSLMAVFARQEFESWLIAGAEGFRDLLKRDATIPEHEDDEARRNAKGWLRANLQGGYRPAADQARFAHRADLDAMRRRSRSFRRLENAVAEILAAVRSNQHTATPT